MVGTGFGQETRYLSTALAADGHSVYVYTVSVNIKTDFYDPRLPDKNNPVHVVPILNVEHQLDGFDLLIALYNPEYISQASIYYDRVFEGVKPKRKIGYFVHECRWVPKWAGPLFYNYKGDYDLVMTTPAQDLWGYHEKYPDKVHFIPHMIDTAHFAPSSRERLSRKYITAVMTNNNWRKRWDFVVEALAETLSKGVFWKDWRFVVSEPQGLFRLLDMMASASQYDSVHGTPQAEAAQAQKRKPNVEIGPAEDIREVYWRTRALLNPTTGEAFSLPIAEALASGVPFVVATRLPELEELYGDALTYIEGYTWLLPDGSYQKMPSFDDFLALLMKIIEGEVDEIPQDKRAVAVEKFDIAKVYPSWKALIEGRASERTNERETSQQINK
jgi:glycosyltransferase involved in cell wall biosynthesis